MLPLTVIEDPAEPAELSRPLRFRQAQPLMVLPVMDMFTGLKVVMA